MHNIVHIQIKVTDLGLAMKFYHKIFNWKVYMSPDADYLAIYEIDELDEYVGGGFLLSNSIPQDTNVLLFVNTNNITESLKKVVNNGGKVITDKTPLPGEHGFSAKFADPFGNIIGLFSET